MNEVVKIEDGLPTKPTRQVFQVIDPIPVLDTARFEHMQRVASVIARSNLIPESLSSLVEGTGSNRKVTRLPDEQVMANCFLVVNQAVRWGMDPFAVAQCVSVVHGKLCYEGKLIAAVIEAKLGIRLKYEWDGKTGDSLGIRIGGKYPDEDETRIVEGTVGGWKTDGAGSPWKTQPKKQLAYRGAREWGRLHAPGIMLGVYSDDEMDDLGHSSRSSRAMDVTPARRAPSASAPTIEHRPNPQDPVVGREPEKPAEKPIQGRRAPSASPPPAKQETPPPATTYDPEKVRNAFDAAAKKANDRDGLNEAWEQHVGQWWDAPELPEGHPDRADLERLYRLHAARVDGEEGAQP